MPRKEPSKTITQQISELDAAIEWFYGEDFCLDQAITKYKQVSSLAETINKNLNDLKNEVEVIGDFTKN